MTFQGESDLVVLIGRYANGRYALRLITSRGEPLATVSVNMPDVAIAADHVILQDSGDFEGMVNWLVGRGVITHPLYVVLTDDGTRYPVCALKSV